MKRESELQLTKIKTEIFQEVIDAERTRMEEFKMGIVHSPSCFSQVAPWKRKTPKQRFDEVLDEYNS